MRHVRINILGFSLVELVMSIGLFGLIASVAGSMMVYMQTRQAISQRQVKMVELMSQIKLNLDEYNSCSANFFEATLPPSGTTTIKAINQYTLNPANPNAPVPANVLKSGTLIAAGQLAENVMVTGIRLEGKGTTQAITGGTQIVMADLVVSFDPNANGTIQERRLPLGLITYTATDAVEACNLSQDNGSVNADAACQLLGQTFNPATGECSTAAAYVTKWFYGNNPDHYQCPAGYTVDPFTSDQGRCTCSSPPGWKNPLPIATIEMADGTYSSYTAKPFTVKYDPTLGCECTYAVALGDVSKWTADILCISE